MTSNPYTPGSVAAACWFEARARYQTHGRHDALVYAKEVDRNINIDLERKVKEWKQ